MARWRAPLLGGVCRAARCLYTPQLPTSRMGTETSVSMAGMDGAPFQSLPYVQRRWSQFASGFSLPMPKTLESIMKVELTVGLPGKEVTALWNDYHIGRGHISASMGTPLYRIFENRAKQCPMFVLPVLKDKGYISMVVQVQVPHLLYTGLEDFKVRGPRAAPFFAVTHYTELAQSKELVLVRGDVVLPSQLSDDEARALLKNTHAFYLEDGKYAHVKTFNKDPQSFDFKAVLRAMGMAT